MIFGRPLTTSAYLSNQWNKLTKSDSDKLQKASGMTLFDSMRCYFQGVAAGVEIQLWSTLSYGISYCFIHLHSSLLQKRIEAGLSQPVFQNANVSQVLSDIRERLTESALKGMANELLLVIPMVMHFVEAVVMQSDLANSFSLEFHSLVSLYQLV